MYPATTYSPSVKTDSISGSACAAQGKSTIVDYYTKVTPALTQAPPMPSAGVNGAGTYAGSVDTAQTYGPEGGSEYAAAPAGSQADPVNTATGALSHSESDLGLASKTDNLSVNRFYTSADTAEGPFGWGWSLGYDISGTTNYTYDSAQRLTEIKSPSGTTIVRTAYDTTTGRVSDQWRPASSRFR